MRYIRINDDNTLAENSELLYRIPYGEDESLYAKVILSETPDFKPGLHTIVWDNLPTLTDGSWVLGYTLETTGTQEEHDKIVSRFSKGIRGFRDKLLAESDWVVTKSLELGEAVPEDWLTYRQALRDITSQEGFPLDVTWPTKPE
jgi:hypothetical protein